MREKPLLGGVVIEHGIKNVFANMCVDFAPCSLYIFVATMLNAVKGIYIVL